MGVAEIDEANSLFLIHAKIFCYGTKATPELSELIADEIMELWNSARANVRYKGSDYLLELRITAEHKPDLTPEDILENNNPLYNYFRIEEKAPGNISFVDGLGSNTGFFQENNLTNKSTTAAHEFGHTLGLDHPEDLDIRGSGEPGIMYPRGTLVDAQYQYYPEVVAGTNGGTINPAFRKVLQQDVDNLGLGKLRFKEGYAIIGKFSSRYHPKYI